MKMGDIEAIDPLDPAAEWRERVRKAREVAYAAMTPEMRASFDSEQQARRVRRRDRKRVRREKSKRIFERVLRGETAQEISAAENIGLSQLRFHWSGLLMSRPNARRLFAWLPTDNVAALNRLADDNGVDRSVVLARIVAFALDDDARVARRIFSKARRVK